MWRKKMNRTSVVKILLPSLKPKQSFTLNLNNIFSVIDSCIPTLTILLHLCTELKDFFSPCKAVDCLRECCMLIIAAFLQRLRASAS